MAASPSWFSSPSLPPSTLQVPTGDEVLVPFALCVGTSWTQNLLARGPRSGSGVEVFKVKKERVIKGACKVMDGEGEVESTYSPLSKGHLWQPREGSSYDGT